tara:strand:+ start:68 stop:256 length:189 start_codon:yes stop_codon:yes gene_type:complete
MALTTIFLFFVYIFAGVSLMGTFTTVLCAVPALLIIITVLDIITFAVNKTLNKNICLLFWGE